MGLILLPVLAPAVIKGILLAILWKPRNQVCVTGGDALLLKCLGNFGDKLEQCKTGVDKALAFAGFLSKGRHVISREVEKPLETLRLFIGMHIDSLAVFDQLPFEGLLIGEGYNAGRNLRKLGELRSAVATCASDNLKAIGIWSGDNWLN